jgi:hypothetical protein
MKLSESMSKITELQGKIIQKDMYIVELKETNENLIKEQAEFQAALIQKIKEINNLGPFKRFMAYGRLMWDLIATIEQAISKANK